MVESPVKVCLPQQFHTLEVKSESNVGNIVLRARLLNKSDVLRWVEDFEKETSSKWNSQRKMENDQLERYKNPPVTRLFNLSTNLFLDTFSSTNTNVTLVK
jgi:hypothetical protein